MADKAAINTELHKFWMKTQAKIDAIQAFLDDEVKRSEALNSELVKKVVSEKSLERQRQFNSDDSQEVEGQKCSMDGAVGKKRRSETIIISLLEQLLSVSSDVNTYYQRLSLRIERFTASIADGFSGLLYNLGKNAKR